MKIFLSVFILLINKILYNNCEVSELKHVQILFRHGDRGPISIFPHDINQADKWPNGLGELTDKGMVQHFHLGMWLRRRYNNYLGSSLNYSFIYVRSSDVSRTLMSAQMNLAGIFYNSSKELIQGLKWHPYPIHTRKLSEDYLLRGDMCGLYRKICKKVAKSKLYQDKFKPYEKTLQIIRNNTGLHNLAFSDSWTIYDTLFTEKANNLTVNDWVTDQVWNQMSAINDINWEIMANKEGSKLIAGFLLKRLVDKVSSIAKSMPMEKVGSKIIIYSGHDTDVAPLAALLGIYNNKQPVYTSAILIELHYIRTRQEKWAVQVIYKNFTDSSGSTNIPAAIIPGCNSTLCPLSRFLEFTKPNILTKEEFQDICYHKVSILFIVQVVFAVVAIGFIIFIIIMWLTTFYRKPRGYVYTPVETSLNAN